MADQEAEEKHSREMKPSAEPKSPGLSWYGVMYAALAAIGYATANAFLRQLSDGTPHEWVVTCKAGCTTLIFLPWLLFVFATGRIKSRIFPPLKICLLLFVAALFVQLAGNLAFQWSLEQIGMALSVPLLMSIMIIAGATLGKICLGEPVSGVMKIVMVMFIAAIFLLGLGAANPSQPEVNITSKTWPVLGAIAAASAGFAYAFLGLSLRTSLKYNIPLATPMVIVGATGVVMIGTMTFRNHGFEIVRSTDGPTWFCLIGAALCNSLAFLSLSKAFKHLPLVYVNVTNVAQIAMTTLTAIFYFGERFSMQLGIGLAIMFAGYLILGSQPRKSPAASKPAQDD